MAAITYSKVLEIVTNLYIKAAKVVDTLYNSSSALPVIITQHSGYGCDTSDENEFEKYGAKRCTRFRCFSGSTITSYSKTIADILFATLQLLASSTNIDKDQLTIIPGEFNSEKCKNITEGIACKFSPTLRAKLITLTRKLYGTNESNTPDNIPAINFDFGN